MTNDRMEQKRLDFLIIREIFDFTFEQTKLAVVINPQRLGKRILEPIIWYAMDRKNLITKITKLTNKSENEIDSLIHNLKTEGLIDYIPSNGVNPDNKAMIYLADDDFLNIIIKETEEWYEKNKDALKNNYAEFVKANFPID